MSQPDLAYLTDRVLLAEGEGPQRSPFTRIELLDDRLFVKFEGRQYDLVSIDYVSSERLREEALTWKENGEWMLAGYLGKLLAIGNTPQSDVSLTLLDVQTGQYRDVERAAMNHANRNKAFAFHPK